jgi:DNA-binding NtrC family response regulator
MHVLIIETEERFRDWLKEHFLSKGYAVRTAGSVRDGKCALMDDRFDVVICGCRFPDGSALELFRGRNPIASMIVTDPGADTEATRAAGFTHHLFKPFPLAYLDSLLNDALKDRPTEFQSDVTGSGV